MKTAELRREARHAIDESISRALKDKPKLRGDLDKLFLLVAKSYPFGARKGDQWRCWLSELKHARTELADRPVGSDGIDRPCPVCRVKPGKPCKSVGENDNLAPEFMAAAGQAVLLRGNKAPGRQPQGLIESVMHPQRRDPNAPMTGVVSAA